MENLLKKRVRYFLASRRRGRDQVRDTIRELTEMGAVVLIGGMLRDLALSGNAHFHSDLDFVINPVNPDLFEAKMASMGSVINRFGGYSLPSGKWKVDVWSLHKTWAKTAGYLTITDFDDLKAATFFSCDAILYNLSTKEISAAEGYFDNIHRRVIEINFRPNPNPQGNAVRAFRYAILKGFKWGPRLTQFVAEILDESGWECLVARERSSFNTMHIANLSRDNFEGALRRHLSQAGRSPFVPIPYSEPDQLDLPFA
jgi:hypothetical protein